MSSSMQRCMISDTTLITTHPPFIAFSHAYYACTSLPVCKSRHPLPFFLVAAPCQLLPPCCRCGCEPGRTRIGVKGGNRQKRVSSCGGTSPGPAREGSEVLNCSPEVRSVAVLALVSHGTILTRESSFLCNAGCSRKSSPHPLPLPDWGGATSPPQHEPTIVPYYSFVP